MRAREKGFSGDAVTYSGSMYCAIRSTKHSGSSTYHHLQDMKRVGSLDIFDDSFNNDISELKPIMIVIIDGGVDENARYAKTIKCAINYFTTQESGGFFLATNVPCRSAFNGIESLMAKFSQKLSGTVLSHNKFESHLNSKGETIDSELEKINSMLTGQIFTEIWSGMMIAGHPVLTENINEEAEEEILKKSLEWKSNDICESQYFL